MDWQIININEVKVTFDLSLKDKVKSFKEEVLDHVKRITDKHDEVYLLLSGGMDSRFLALILLELGVDFTAITFSFDPNYNENDVFISKSFTKKYNIKHEIFYLSQEEFAGCVDFYGGKNFFINIMHAYNIFCTVHRYNKPKCAFLSGACSEFKIENKKISLGHWVEFVKKIHPNFYNFTTERIFLSYLNEKIIRENWENKYVSSPFYLRNLVYTNIYPELDTNEKRGVAVNTNHLDYFLNFVCDKYCRKYPHIFATKNFCFDLETYYKGSNVK